MKTIPAIDDDSGIGIGPGVVVVDLTASGSITPAEMREAFAEAEAQQLDADVHLGDLLGDLDLHPL